MSETFIHPTAVVSPHAAVGTRTRIWCFAQVREGARIGAGSTIGKDVYVDRDVTIGERVKVQNGVSIYRGVSIEDDVFIGPGATFTNDPFPRASNDAWTPVPTIVRRGASVGANATILCGVTIGEQAMVGAGAVVTADVPPLAVVAGNPARILRLLSGGPRSTGLGDGAHGPEFAERLPVMLLGYGAMGANHARVLTALRSRFHLCVIADTDPGRRAAAKEDHPDALVFGEAEQGLDLVEAVVVATPPATHYALTRLCLEAGKHCLVEKPLTILAAEALELATTAAAKGLVLLPGHTERYNPAVEALIELVNEDAGRLLAVSAERLGPGPRRAGLEDVVLDLMVHDLDLACQLAGSEVARVSASGIEVGGCVEYASAILSHRNGPVSTITASRQTQNRVRKLSVTTDRAYYVLDYLARSVEVSRHAATSYLHGADRLGVVQNLTREHVSFGSSEPLERQACGFWSSIREGVAPRIRPADAVAVIALSEDIRARIADGAQTTICGNTRKQVRSRRQATNRARCGGGRRGENRPAQSRRQPRP